MLQIFFHLTLCMCSVERNSYTQRVHETHFVLYNDNDQYKVRSTNSKHTGVQCIECTLKIPFWYLFGQSFWSAKKYK